jgi:hypothetical protein
VTTAAYKRRRATASSEYHTPTSLHSALEQQGDVALKAHIARVCFICFRCFIGILQVFHMDVVKIDCDVVHVAMVKRLIQIFHLLFQTYVESVLI